MPQVNERGPQARDDAAATFGISGRTVDAGAKILKHGSPEVIAAVERGDIKASTAARLVDAPKKVQKEAVAGGKPAIRAAIEKLAPSPSEEAANDPGVLWARSLRKLTTMVVGTREAGGIVELTARWTDAQREEYIGDISELIEELKAWKIALTTKSRKR